MENSERGNPRGGDLDLGAAGIISLVAAILALPFLAGISMLDEGTLVHIADRLASGEVLYRDVATGVMPGSYYLHALLFLVFGRSLLVGRVFMIVLFAFTSAGVYLTARSVTTRPIALAAALSFVALSVHHWRVPGYSPEAISLVFLTIAVARVFLETRAPRWLVLTGLSLGVTILFKQNYGALASLGVAVGLVAGAPAWRRAVRDVALAGGTAALPITVTAAMFAGAGAWADFWHFTVEVPLQLPSTVFARPWPSLWGAPDDRLFRDVIYYLPFQELAITMGGWFDGHLWLSMSIIRATYYLPPLFLLATVVVWFRKRNRLRRTRDANPGATRELGAGALYLGTSLFLLLGVFPRVDTHHLFMALGPAFVLAAWVAGSRPRPAVCWGASILAAALISLCAVSQVLSITDKDPEQVRDSFLSYPRARIWAGRWQASEIQHQLRRIEQRVPEDESLFVAPAMPLYYFLAERTNPTRYPLILPGALDEGEVVRTLEEARVGYALISDIAFESFPFPYVAPRVWSYLEDHFRPVEGAEWGVSPHPPYLYTRGPRPELPSIELVTEENGELVSVSRDHGGWDEGEVVTQPPLSPKPVYQTVAVDGYRPHDPWIVSWQSVYLEPSLVVRAPGGWRKVLVSWDVSAEPGHRFEFACALTPFAWAGWPEGQGALVEAWVSPSPETGPPRRAWWRWINPRAVAEDRRWHRAALDLSALVDTDRAVVTLVTGSAPSFSSADAIVAWSGLRLLARKVENEPFRPRNVRLTDATARHMLGFTDEDLRVFQEAAERYPHLANVHSALAEVASSLGKHGLAVRASEEAVRLDPDEHSYWIRLGQELQGAGRIPDAIEAMRKAIEIEPTNPNYHAAIAGALIALPDKLEDAKAASLEALRLDRNNTWAWTLLSSAARQTGELEVAVDAAEESVRLEPSAAWPRLLLAEAFLAIGRTHEARQTLERAASLDMDAGARSALARNLLGLGLLERARDEASRATAQDPRFAAGWTILGHAQSALEQWEPAVRAWRRVVELDPNNSSALVQLARALARTTHELDALDALRRARSLAGDDPARLREVAVLFDEVGSFDEAIPIWYRVSELAPPGALKQEADRRLRAVSNP